MRHPGANRWNITNAPLWVTNDIPAQYHPPRSEGQRRYFYSKQARTSLHLKKGGKKGVGEITAFQRGDYYFILFPPYPKCKGHQNISTELKQEEVRVCVYGGNKSKLQGIARRAVMSSWRGSTEMPTELVLFSR